MNKNQIGGIRCRTSGRLIAKSISIKGTGCRSGGCAWKAVELTSGGLRHVPESGLRMERSILTVRQKSAAGIVAARVAKAQTEGSGQ
jgi:hypothetical protein